MAEEQKTKALDIMPDYEGPKDLIVHDDSEFANLLDTAKFNHFWRLAKLFSSSQMVPERFQGDPCSTFIVLQMFPRLKVDPFMLLQKTYVVYGIPGIEGQLAIALINTRGPFTGSIQWRFEPSEEKPTKCVAYAKHKVTGETCQMTITMEMVKANGWWDKKDSKWPKMTAQMFRYRTAMWLGRAYCPEVLMGLYSVDELMDGGTGETIDVTPEPIEPEPPEQPQGPSLEYFLREFCSEREHEQMKAFLEDTAAVHKMSVLAIIAEATKSDSNLDQFLATFDAWAEKQPPPRSKTQPEPAKAAPQPDSGQGSAAPEPTESEAGPPPEPPQSKDKPPEDDENALRALMAKKGVDQLYQRQFPELSVDDIIKALADMDGGELKAATRKKLIASLSKQPVDCTLVTKALENKTK